MREDPEETTSIHKGKGMCLEPEDMRTEWGGHIVKAQTLRNLIKVNYDFSPLIIKIKNLF